MKDSPGFNASESNSPSSEVTVCGVLPRFTHITVSPGWMATSAGSKSKSSISTDDIFGVVWAIMSWGCCAPATGTNTSRAKKERATKHDRRLIDTTSLCATSFSRNPGFEIATNMTMTPDRAAVNACKQTLIKLLESLERVFWGAGEGGRSWLLCT